MVSIHAPAWGATTIQYQASQMVECFNSRTRMGCDPKAFKFSLDNPEVSIHAPAWGATRAKKDHDFKMWFQFTHPHGVRQGAIAPPSTYWGFQFTHPHGVRRLYTCKRHKWTYVSIHAPAWGATLYTCKRHKRTHVSIHAPAWGATFSALFLRHFHILFQFTHPHGVRLP